MEQFLLIMYVLVAAAMVGLILLQQGKGADMGASFGSGASQTLFGSAGSGNVLTRTTAILATLFFIGSVGLSMMAKQHADEARTAAIPVPAVVENRAAPIPKDAAKAEIPTAASNESPATSKPAAAAANEVVPATPGAKDPHTPPVADEDIPTPK